jgi:vacuolar iron transporter family protein
MPKRSARPHPEKHLLNRIGWLRAAVLGANDGIISTASLIVGVASAATSANEVVVAGVAGAIAGSMSMAAGEYMSVSSQAETESADLARERQELADNSSYETNELAQIYVERGLERALARQVAAQLMVKDALAAHARDELGISEAITARPIQAALTSAATFAAFRFSSQCSRRGMLSSSRCSALHWLCLRCTERSERKPEWPLFSNRRFA